MADFEKVVIGNCTLYRADCRDVLPTLEAGSVHCTVTSPPYNTLPTKNIASGMHAERRKGVNQWISRASDGYFDSRPEHEYQDWLRSILDVCFRVTDGLVWVNHKIRYRDGEAIHPARMLPYPIYSEVIWDRRGSMALNCKRYAPSTEHLLAFGKPKTWNDELNALLSVWRIGFDYDQNEHPCSFPVELAERPIISSTNEGDTVLDPFAGSGTVGVACARTGRKFVGVEIEKRYFDLACRRIAECNGDHGLYADARIAEASLFTEDT